MWILETRDQSGAPVVFRVPPGTVKTIGRSSGADFVVDAALVSRLHCRLTASSTTLQVTDLDSTNGTFVNGKRVKSAELKAGDWLAVGRLELSVSKEAA